MNKWILIAATLSVCVGWALLFLPRPRETHFAVVVDKEVVSLFINGERVTTIPKNGVHTTEGFVVLTQDERWFMPQSFDGTEEWYQLNQSNRWPSLLPKWKP